MRRRPPKIPLHSIMLNRLLQHPRRLLRLIFPVAFVRFRQRIRRIVGFFEVVLLDLGGAFEGLSGFFAGFLESEGVCCLGVEVDCVFVFFCFAAEEGETAAGALGGFVRLKVDILISILLWLFILLW